MNCGLIDVTLTLTDHDTRTNSDVVEDVMEDGQDSQPYLCLADQDESTLNATTCNKFKLTLSSSSLSRPSVPRRDEVNFENSEPATFQEKNTLSIKSAKTPRRKRDMRNPVEILMHEQVDLLREQVLHLSGINESLKRMCDIEDEKLTLKKSKKKNPVPVTHVLDKE